MPAPCPHGRKRGTSGEAVESTRHIHLECALYLDFRRALFEAIDAWLEKVRDTESSGTGWEHRHPPQPQPPPPPPPVPSRRGPVLSVASFSLCSRSRSRLRASVRLDIVEA